VVSKGSGEAALPCKANLLADTRWDITADLGGHGMVWKEVFGKILQVGQQPVVDSR
jgi:hypothetical protein